MTYTKEKTIEGLFNEIKQYRFECDMIRDNLIFENVELRNRIEELEAACYRRPCLFLRHYFLEGEVYVQERTGKYVDIEKIKEEGWSLALCRQSDDTREIWIKRETLDVEDSGGFIGKVEFTNFCEQKRLAALSVRASYESGFFTE